MKRYFLVPGCLLIIALGLAACGSSQPATEEPAATALIVAEATATSPAPAPAEPTIAVTATVSESTNAEATPGQFDRRAMIANIVETLIVPQTDQFQTEAAKLQTLVEQFASQPTPETLTAAQDQWRVAAELWAKLEPLNLPLTMMIAPQIKKWPVNTDDIEEFIAQTEPINSLLEPVGSPSKGLGAIEYLLFSQTAEKSEIIDSLTKTPRRMEYLVALAQNLALMGNEMVLLWSPEGSNQAQTLIDADLDNEVVSGALSRVCNEIIAVVENTIKMKLDYPLHGELADPQPNAVESPYAGDSTPLIIATLRGVQQIFHAGLGDYLDYLAISPPEVPLSKAIDAQIKESIAALEAIDLPLEKAVLEDAESVRAARDTLKQLLVLVKVDMANQLGIIVTFTDSDGD